MTPRSLDTAFIPASLPGVIFTSLLHVPGSQLPASSYYRELEVLYGGGRHRLVDNLLNRQGFFRPQHIGAPGFGGRVPRSKQRAAVLVRDDRDGIRPQALGLLGNL